MHTLGEVRKFIGKCLTEMEMFGHSEEFRPLFSQRARELGRAIAEELGITIDQAKGLPDEQKLGPRASEAFETFRAWFEKNQ